MLIPPAGAAQPFADVYRSVVPEQPDAKFTWPPQLELGVPQVQAEHLRVSVKLSYTSVFLP